ncbi:MAG: 3-oxoadipate enol-lactonase [Gaiellales bacterium]|nr:3-oxoadipate enol-lactonase [Gaiellales bacterium]
MLYHEQAGTGAAVVLIHEGVGDSRMWDLQWRTFTERYRTVRYDMRGFGRSALPEEPFAHAADLAALIDELGIARTALVAGSMGGRVALELAVDRPDLVSALVLVAPGLPGHDWSDEMRAYDAAEEQAIEAGDLDAAVELNVRYWVVGSGRAPDDVDPAVRDRVREMQRRAFELQLAAPGADEELLVGDLAARVGEISVPTLVLVGEHDSVDMHRIADGLVAEISGARSERMEGTAHVPNMERPQEFNHLVLGFLADGR